MSSAPGPVASGFGEVANMRITNGVSPGIVARETLKELGRTGTVRPGLLSKLLEGLWLRCRDGYAYACSNR